MTGLIVPLCVLYSIQMKTFVSGFTEDKCEIVESDLIFDV